MNFLLLLINTYNPFYLGAGDSVDIIVLGPEINSEAFSVVSSEGYLPIRIQKTPISESYISQYYEILTVIDVQGKDIETVRNMIEDSVKAYLGDVKVKVIVSSPRYSVKITQGPAVAEAGMPTQSGERLQYFPEFTIWDYLLRASTVNTYQAIEEVYLIKRDGRKIYIPQESLRIKYPDWGDVIFVPQKFIFVEGAVPSPGAFPYVEGEDVFYYIGLAGGIVPHRGNLGKAYVVKAETGEKISIKKIEKIEPNDKIVIPENLFTWRDVVQYIPSIVNIGLMIYSIFFIPK